MRSRTSVLVPGGAQLRRSARRCGGPARPAPGGAARRSAGSQATTVSRWLVIPIASSSAPSMPAAAIASAATRRVTSQISPASCSTQPGPREVLLELRVGAAGDPRPRASKTRQVVPVVPWSIARITRGTYPASAWAPRTIVSSASASAADVFLSGSQPAQREPVHQRHDRARVALGVGHLEHLEGRPRRLLRRPRSSAGRPRAAPGRGPRCRCSSISARSWIRSPATRARPARPRPRPARRSGPRARSSAAIASRRATSSPTKSSRLSRSRSTWLAKW